MITQDVRRSPWYEPMWVAPAIAGGLMLFFTREEALEYVQRAFP